jgi:hypothetical protein
MRNQKSVIVIVVGTGTGGFVFSSPLRASRLVGVRGLHL